MASTSSSSNRRSAPRIRPATLADKEAWVDVQLAGYEIDLQFTWRYPKRKEFPGDARNGTGNMFEAALANENMTCLVAELPSIEKGESEHEEWVVAAIAVWEWKTWEEVEGGAGLSMFSSPTSGRRDMDPNRQRIFLETLHAAEKQYFGAEWGKKRLELSDMVADPKYHRRGAGKALMEYGLQKAREHHVPITLTSSPLGRHLYKHVGFKELGYVECGIEGEEQRVGTWVMAWHPEGWEKETIQHA